MARKQKSEPGYGRDARKRVKVNSEAVCDILNKHNIADTFLNRVQQALESYSCEFYFLDGFNAEGQKIAPGPTESRSRLNSLRRHAEVLAEGFESLDRNALHLMGGDLDFINKTHARVVALCVLLDHYTSTEGNIPEAAEKEGRTPHTAKSNLVLRLADIYHEATKKKASVTWNAYSETYTGRFLNLTYDLMCHVSPETKKQSLGKFIKDALASRTKSQK